MRIKDKPKIVYREIPDTKPPPPPQLGDGGAGPGAAESAKGEGKGKPQAEAQKPAAGFGVTDDQTDDINPLTSNKSRVGDDDKSGALGGAGLANLKLPSEMGEAGAGADIDAFGAIDAMYEGAAADMDRGVQAQQALHGTGVPQMEATEVPTGMGPTEGHRSVSVNPREDEAGLHQELSARFDQARLMGKEGIAAALGASSGQGDPGPGGGAGGGDAGGGEA